MHMYKSNTKLCILSLYACLGSAILHEECGDEPLRAGAGGHDQWGDEGGLKDKIIMLLQVEKKGVIYFDDVCKLILRKFREDDEEEFNAHINLERYIWIPDVTMYSMKKLDRIKILKPVSRFLVEKTNGTT